MMESKSKQDEAGTSKSFPKMPTRELDERIVITITPDSQTTDGEENITAADEGKEDNVLLCYCEVY